MADVNKTIQISYEAKTQDLEKALKRIPNITEREVKEMSVVMQRHFKKTERAAERSSKNIGQSFKKAGRAVASIGGAAIIAGAGILAFGQQLADLSNELVDASTKTGLAVETLSGLRFAAAGAGVGFQQLEAGLIKLSGAIQSASEESGPAFEAFERLGIAAKDTDGNLRSAEDVFRDITRELSAVENQTEKTALAMDIFGMRAGPSLLQSGALDNLDAFVSLSREFGVNMGEVSEDAADFQRAMAELKETTQGTAAEILQVVIGTEDLTSAIFKVSDGVVFVGAIFDAVFETMKSAIDLVLKPISLMNDNLEQTVQLLHAVMTQDVSAMGQALSNIGNNFLDVGLAAVDVVDNVIDLTNATETARQRVQELQKAREKILEQNKQNKKDTIEQAQAEKLSIEAQKEAAKLADEQRKAEQAANAERLAGLKELQQIAQSSRQATLSQEQIEIEALEAKRDRINELFELTQDIDAANLAMSELQGEADKKAHDRRMAQMQKEKDSRMAFLDILVSSAGTMAQAIQATLENTGQITKQQAARLHTLSKTAAVSDIAINTAVAISKALAQLGPIAGPVAAGLVTASGAAQTAAVLSQPPPTFDMGGMIGNLDIARPNQTFIRAQQGEAVLDETTVNSLGGEEGINALQRGEGMSPQVIVLNPFKHLDRYNRSALQQNSSLNSAIRGARSFGSGAY